MKHKHHDLIIAYASGSEIEWWSLVSNEWKGTDNPSWYNDYEYRIKPTPRPQWQQDLIDAAKAGKVVEFNYGFSWGESDLNQRLDLYNFGDAKQDQYRIKPKPDITQSCEISFNFASFNSGYPTVQFTFDGETGKLKAAEVL